MLLVVLLLILIGPLVLIDLLLILVWVELLLVLIWVKLLVVVGSLVLIKLLLIETIFTGKLIELRALSRELKEIWILVAKKLVSKLTGISFFHNLSLRYSSIAAQKDACESKTLCDRKFENTLNVNYQQKLTQ